MSAPTLSEDSFARLINIAARQRMLSQRVALLLLYAQFSEENTNDAKIDLSTNLSKTLANFHQGVRVLLAGDENVGLPLFRSKRVDTILNGPGHHGRAIIDRFVKTSEEYQARLQSGEALPASRLSEFAAFSLGELLDVLQDIVAALELDFQEFLEHRQARRAEDTKQVKRAVADIQKASKVSRMVALNAKISADRAGDYGREFGALTDELKQISSNINESSDSILKHLRFT